MELLNKGFIDDGRVDWLQPAGDLYREIGQLDKLKSVLEERIKIFDERGFPWRKRCFPYFIESLQSVSMNDSVESMMVKCREETEERLKAGYLCPCSWYKLVVFAILDERYDDAIKRAEEWLDNGDSYHRLDTDILFSKLKDRPEYPELLKRNEQQLERQKRIYTKLSEVTEAD